MSETFEKLFKFKEDVAKMAIIPVPLNRKEPLGEAVREIMLSPDGKRARLYLEKIRPTCIQFPRGIFILSDGNVTTCCHDPLGRNSLGTVYRNSLKDLWNSAVSNIVHGDLYDMPVCRDCIGSPAASLTSRPEDISAWQKKASGFPDYIQIEIMGACNYGCCISPNIHHYRPVKPDLDAIHRSIIDFIPHVKELNLFNYGEPLLHDGLGDFVGMCRRSSEAVCINIATNGVLLTEQFAKAFIEHRLNRLIVSVHGGPGTDNMLKYSKYGADYDGVLSNLRRLIEIRRDSGSHLPHISLKAILFNWNDNEPDMERFRSDARSLGLLAGQSQDTDNYYWAMNDGDPLLSSCRFRPGSVELQQLKDASEI